MNIIYRHYDFKSSKWFINLTNHEICVYESYSGKIVRFPHTKRKLPEKPHVKNDENTLYYIVEAEVAEELRMRGRHLNDIAIVHRVASGRGNTTITSLVWGENTNVRVILRNNKFVLVK